MKVRLEALDSKHPNLALMKLSAYHKAQGDIVGFNTVKPDRVYISVIFTKNYVQAKGMSTWWDSEVIIGGPGTGKPTHLEPEIEHIMPDYSLYGIDYSIGFTTRGCFRKCSFCIVPDIEGPFREHAPIEEFHHPSHKNIILYDNNILASENLYKTLDYIIDHNLKVSFCQGLDARLITNNIAKRLKLVKSYNSSFKNRRYYFAWDMMEEEQGVIQGLEIMINQGILQNYLTVYVLVGFNTTYEQDMYRVTKLLEYGVRPFIMIYNYNRKDPWLKCLAKYINRMYYKSIELKDYKPYKTLVRKHHVSPFE